MIDELVLKCSGSRESELTYVCTILKLDPFYHCLKLRNKYLSHITISRNLFIMEETFRGQLFKNYMSSTYLINSHQVPIYCLLLKL